jgi:hypothetical protein
MSHNYKEIYAFRAAMRWAWDHPPAVNTCVALRIEFRDRKLKLTLPYIRAFKAANTQPFHWHDPSATCHPTNKHGQPEWNSAKIDRLRRKQWIAAAEALLPKE